MDPRKSSDDKEEIRTISLAKLELCEHAVLYDVGAGTGSVAVEAAGRSDTIRVYAVEQKEEGIRLIEENKRKFRADWVTPGFRKSAGSIGTTGTSDSCVYRRKLRKFKRNPCLCEAKESGCPDRAERDLSGDAEGSAGSAGMRTFAKPGDRTGQRIESADIGRVSYDDRIESGLHYFGGTSGTIRRSMRKGVMKQQKKEMCRI